MKEINSFELIEVPEGIEASVKARAVTVKGKRGTLTKVSVASCVLSTPTYFDDVKKLKNSHYFLRQEFKHLAVDIYMTDAKTIKESIC